MEWKPPAPQSLAELKARSVARNWPALEQKVIRGQAGGQVLWQPRILAWRADKRFFGEPMPEPYEQLSTSDMYRYLDCSARIYEFNTCFRLVEHPTVRITQYDLGQGRTLTAIETPVGEQMQIVENLPTCRSPIYVKRPITTLEDLRVATWRVEHAYYVFDQETFDSLLGDWGDLGLPTMFIPRVKIQDLYINTMGTQAAIYALVDWGDAAFLPYFRALDDLSDQLIDLINRRPEFEVINFGDNLHSGTLPPAWFEKHVLPAYRHRCDRLHRAGKFVHAHWDGTVRSLLRYARETGLDGIEAITPEPQGDVTLAEVKAALGDKVFLLDGIPAVYFDDTYSVAELKCVTHEVIELFSPRLILGISDEMNAHGDIERVRLVGQMVDEHNSARR